MTSPSSWKFTVSYMYSSGKESYSNEKMKNFMSTAKRDKHKEMVQNLHKANCSLIAFVKYI